MHGCADPFFMVTQLERPGESRRGRGDGPSVDPLVVLESMYRKSFEKGEEHRRFIASESGRKKEPRRGDLGAGENPWNETTETGSRVETHVEAHNAAEGADPRVAAVVSRSRVPITATRVRTW